MIEFKDQVVILTGSTRGIGKAIGETLASLGADVIGIGKKDVDLSNEKATIDFADSIRKLDRLDICIHNAGVIYSSQITDFSNKRNEYNALMNINLKAAVEITSAAAEVMIKNKYGKIVNVASIAGTRVRDGRSAYSSSKHALIGFTKSIAVDLAPHNILANTVSPGFTMTEMTESVLSKEDMESLIRQIPMGRFAEPKDIANAVAFLASKLNTFITGQDIIVDGGFTNTITI